MVDVPFEPLGYVWRVLFVFALLFAVAFLLRRIQQRAIAFPSGRKQMHVVETLAIGPQRHLHIVQVDGRRFLIGVTPQQITFLTELSTSVENALSEAAKPAGDENTFSFRAFLKKAGGGTPKEEAER